MFQKMTEYWMAKTTMLLLLDKNYHVSTKPCVSDGQNLLCDVVHAGNYYVLHQHQND